MKIQFGMGRASDTKGVEMEVKSVMRYTASMEIGLTIIKCGMGWGM